MKGAIVEGWIIGGALGVTSICGGMALALVIRRIILGAVRRAVHDFANDVLRFERRHQRAVLMAVAKQVRGESLTKFEQECLETLRRLSPAYRKIL